MDEDGYVFVTGRLKELIIKGGENIAPREIDEVLYEHPDVVEAACIRPALCAIWGTRRGGSAFKRDIERHFRAVTCIV
jgi:acyl-CoA synthetase (AMP-forming)/AMP-acid ligase II